MTVNLYSHIRKELQSERIYVPVQCEELTLTVQAALGAEEVPSPSNTTICELTSENWPTLTSAHNVLVLKVMAQAPSVTCRIS